MGKSGDRHWEAYVVPGTEILRNRFGIQDPAVLSRVESRVTLQRMAKWAQGPTPTTFGFSTLQDIHRYLFQDIYDWAGEKRTGPRVGVMVKGFRGRPYHYLPWAYLDTAIEHVHGRLAELNWLVGLDREEFLDDLVWAWSEINMIHAFREGNTRTQVLFFSALCDNAGFRLDAAALQWGSEVREQFLAARFEAMATADPAALREVLARLVGPAAR